MNTVHRVRALLGPADPAAGLDPSVPDPTDLLARARGDITAEPGARSARPARWPKLAVAGVFVAVLVTTGVAVLRPGPVPGPAYHGTPPALTDLPAPTGPAATCLNPLADRVAETAYDTATGRYARVATFGDQVAYGGDKRRAYQVTDSRSWLAADGAGRVRRIIQPARFPTEEARSWFADHRSEILSGSTVDMELDAGDGRPRPLLTDPAEVARRYAAAPKWSGPSNALNMVSEAQMQLPNRAQRTALLRFLAQAPYVNCLGAVTDPLGRQGVAVSADDSKFPTSAGGGSRRHLVLIFAPDTGELLAELDFLPDEQDTYDGYTVWVGRDRVSDTG
ncbi:hypothetical protein [Longispora urticae]